jgi:hypothetical protein
VIKHVSLRITGCPVVNTAVALVAVATTLAAGLLTFVVCFWLSRRTTFVALRWRLHWW